MRNYDKKNKNMFQVRAYLKELYSFHEQQFMAYVSERGSIAEKLLEVLQFLINETKNMIFMKSFKHFIISVYHKVDMGLDTDREIIDKYHITNLLLNIILTIL